MRIVVRSFSLLQEVHFLSIAKSQGWGILSSEQGQRHSDPQYYLPSHPKAKASGKNRRLLLYLYCHESGCGRSTILRHGASAVPPPLPKEAMAARKQPPRAVSKGPLGPKAGDAFGIPVCGQSPRAPPQAVGIVVCARATILRQPSRAATSFAKGGFWLRAPS